MFNFLFPKGPTFFATLFTLVLYTGIVFFFMPVLTKGKVLTKGQRKTGKFLMFLFLIFPMWGGDVYSYYDFIANEFPKFTGSINALAEEVAVEKVYLYIAHYVGCDYLIWRTVVFGGMLFIGLHIGRRLELNLDKFLACFALFSMFWLSYARASLAMAIGFLGMTYLVKPVVKKKIRSYILGLLLLACSVYFHKSAVIIPGVVLLSLFRINKWTLIAFSLTIPTIVYFFQLYASDFIMDLSVDNAMLNVKSAQGYLSRERADDGFAMATMDSIKRAWMYAVPFCSLYLIWRNKYKEFPFYIQKFINVDIIIIAFASLFLFLNESVRLTLLHRFMYYSLIPVSVVMCALFERHLLQKSSRLLLFLCLFSNFLYIFYSVYLAS